MLENLKPGLEKSTPPSIKSCKASKPLQPDAIDINEIMRDLDEDTGLVKPSRRANLKKTGKSLPIHTLEELDKHIGGKENTLQKAPSVPVVVNLKASLKPVGSAKSSTASTEQTTKDLGLKGDEPKSSSPTVATRDGVISKDSELFDDDFLGSYMSAIPLSEDDWKVVEACRPVEFDQKKELEDKKNIDKVRANMESKDDVTVTMNGTTEPITGIKEAQPHTPSQSERNQYGNDPSELSAPLMQVTVVETRPSPLESYQELCPPGGKHAVVLYTTSLRGIRKTYEECMRVREIVQSFGVLIDERDVSMHLEYRNELRELMERLVTVPRLFIKGRYIGGAGEVTKLLEEGQLACLFEGFMEAHCSSGGACDGCAGARFVPCLECSGICKVVDVNRQMIRCPDCNENGLIQCPICS
eukprot:c26262_g1_i1 orf=3-1244(+)